MLAAKALDVGVNRVIFNSARLNEISEAITRQDIIDLHRDGAIMIREKSGRLKVVRRTRRRKDGNIRNKSKNRKAKYVIMTRKLRRYLTELMKQERVNKEKYYEARIKIRSKSFKDKKQFKEYLGVN